MTDRSTLSVDVANPPLEFNVPYNGHNLTMKLYLWGTRYFNVEIISELENDDIGALADLLSHVLSGLYDSMGLVTGQPQQIHIDGFCLVGTRSFAQMNLGIPSFGREVEAAGLNLQDWTSLVVGSPQLRAAIRDIRLAMQTPGEAAVHCFRSIERIRQAFSVKATDRKQTWSLLAEALNLRRSWLDTYTSHATAVRHGELVELNLEERNRCFAQAAQVVIRYAVYLKTGKLKLSAPKFPELA